MNCPLALTADSCASCLNYTFIQNTCTLCETITTPEDCTNCNNFYFVTARGLCTNCSFAIVNRSCLCPRYYFQGTVCLSCIRATTINLCALCKGHVFLNRTCTPCSGSSSTICLSCIGHFFNDFACQSCYTADYPSSCNNCANFTWYNETCQNCSEVIEP